MRILVEMSGGVDSSVCALLLKDAGHEVVGVTMRMTDDSDDVCADAEAVASLLGIEFHVADVREKFTACVTTPFIQSYLCGLTPNPCIDCNRELKFGEMLSLCDTLGCEKLATGHYARVFMSQGVFGLHKAYNVQKDQSYFLSCLTQAKLCRLLFPLGEIASKDEIRKIAQECGLPTASKRDSQDICFVGNGDYGTYIASRHGKLASGDFVLRDGTVIGTHKGQAMYTIGQRKGLGLSLQNPLYVVSKDATNNRVILGEESELFDRHVAVQNFHFLRDMGDHPFSAAVKVRYRQTEESAIVIPNGDTAKVLFDKPVRAAAPGQTVAVYIGDEVVAGGIVASAV